MNNPGLGAPGGGPQGFPQKDPNMKMMENMMQSCFAKTMLSGVMGFGMGGLFGMFMASMSYDTPFQGGGGTGTGGPAVSSLPLRQQLKLGFRDMGTRSYGMAKNFAMVGGLYSGIECGIEGLRARNDMTNAVAAGCLTGGILARNGGPLAVGGGCAAFAAFSLAIEAWMRSPSDE